MTASPSTRPDYGVDAPAVMRNLLLFGALAFLLIFITPAKLHLGNVVILWHSSLAWMGSFLFGEGLLFLLYVKVGKFRHRDFMLAMHAWQGNERVLDVGCGRGLLLVGAAKHLTTGHATGIDIWSNVDMGGNSAAATEHNIALEDVSARCTCSVWALSRCPLPMRLL